MSEQERISALAKLIRRNQYDQYAMWEIERNFMNEEQKERVKKIENYMKKIRFNKQILIITTPGGCKKIWVTRIRK